MKIFPLTFASARDLDLTFLQNKFYQKSNLPLEPMTLAMEEYFIPSAIEDEWMSANGISWLARPYGFWPWPGWAHCMSKIGIYRKMMMVKGMKDEDYILDVDSDAFIFDMKRVFGNVGAFDVIGFQHDKHMVRRVDRWNRDFVSLSGSMIAMRVSALKKVVEAPEHEMRWAEEWMNSHPPYGMVWDSFICLMLEMIGATRGAPDSGLTYVEGSEMQEVLCLVERKGYAAGHLYGEWKRFAEQDIEGKWKIPSVLARMGLL